MTKPLYKFIGSEGRFRVDNPERYGSLYFPLSNDSGFLSAITPDLSGDIKTDQHTFLTVPMSIEDLKSSRTSRNFWLTFPDRKIAPWSVTGRSVWQKASKDEEPVTLEAGFLWQRVRRASRRLGLEATVLSFVPTEGAFEVMSVEIKNTGRRPVSFTATSAIPLFGRSGENLRDHRHVTSLLHRLFKEPYGIRLVPTMSFNERGHLLNETAYYVVGIDGKGKPPAGLFPTAESFTGLSGDLEKPEALFKRVHPGKSLGASDHGKEAIGALQFAPQKLAPGGTAHFTILIGIDKEPSDHASALEALQNSCQVEAAREITEARWRDKINPIHFYTGHSLFDNWIQWVQVQPSLRRIFGCSFLPDFDYGRGGRGWRDLWQDCLALLLADPEGVREDIVRNYGGVRLDGSNATIIGRKLEGGRWAPEFIADRNNIARTWMDHGAWPFLTTLLYLDQTGDWDLLLETTPYFRDALIERGKKVDPHWREAKPAQGTILEHILLQTLVPFFNVGEHNIIRLEDADWNDGLDMAGERGESVAFTAFYAGNLRSLAALLRKLKDSSGWPTIQVAAETTVLLDKLGQPVNYGAATAKRQRLEDYYRSITSGFSGTRTELSTEKVITDLEAKAEWIREHLNQQEWVEADGEAWYNGYYDNQGRRVEGGDEKGKVRMTLAGQTFPLMFGLADPERAKNVTAAVNRHLFDRELGCVRLNTDFGSLQPDLGRAFSFAYGEKENGAVFSHMAVMYANALYRAEVPSEGFKILDGLFRMAINPRSSLLPGLPEYFNNEGRGRYAFLTGSASWYVLTLLTRAFGVRGEGGDLVLAPQLDPSQFDHKGEARVGLNFAGGRVTVIYRNPKRLKPEVARIVSITSGGDAVPFQPRPDSVLIEREWISHQGKVELVAEFAKVSL